MGNVVKFPYDACRRIHSRKPRKSKNGTPEERAAKAAHAAANSTAAPIFEISRRISTGRPPPTIEAQRCKILETAMALDDEKQLIFLNFLRRLATKGSA
jgi:hypothetical protein